MDAFKIKKGLGRGLSSLIGEAKVKDRVNKVLIGDLIRNKYQPRKVFNKEKLQELTTSIKERGIIQPIIVRPSADQINKFEIIAGERRWLAAQNAGLNEIPVVVLNVDNVKSLEFAIVENVQRQDLNPIEEAQGYQRLIDEFSYDQEKISKFIGKSRSHVANCIRLLNLPNEIISYVENEEITAGHAKILVNLSNAQFIAKKIIDKKLSVRQSENLVRAFKKNSNLRIIPNKNPDILNLERSLENKTGLNVKIKNKKNNSGAVYFEYKNLEQLDRIIDTIKKNY
tara:strand:+ start:72 stop:923 length:852 start_codon:yes stop_codon:yes gene_type:complete